MFNGWLNLRSASFEEYGTIMSSSRLKAELDRREFLRLKADLRRGCRDSGFIARAKGASK
jgi:hypothetical protein